MIPTIDTKLTGRRIRLLMKIRGVSVKDVQKGLSLECVQSVYHWLKGKSMPTLDNLYALSRLLRVPMDALVVGDSDCMAYLYDCMICSSMILNCRKRPQIMDCYINVEGLGGCLIEGSSIAA